MIITSGNSKLLGSYGLSSQSEGTKIQSRLDFHFSNNDEFGNLVYSIHIPENSKDFDLERDLEMIARIGVASLVRDLASEEVLPHDVYDNWELTYIEKIIYSQQYILDDDAIKRSTEIINKMVEECIESKLDALHSQADMSWVGRKHD